MNFWYKLKVISYLVVILLLVAMGVLWIQTDVPKSSSVVVPPANSGQQKQFY